MSATLFRQDRLFLVCMLLSAVFCAIYSVSTSFLYCGNGFDSSIFQIVGKAWANNKIPYTDIWDHKGPYIFFINCLGSLIGNRHGILLLQIINLSFFLFFTFKSFELKFRPLTCFYFTFLTLFWLGCAYSSGNMTEEYILPFISATVFFTLRQILFKINTKDFFKATDVSVSAGLALGIGLCTRLTNAIIPCGIMLFIGCFLLVKKQWRSVLSHICFFLLGVFFILLPFVIYFAFHGALYDLLYGGLLYNITYATESSFSWYGIRKLVLTGFPFFLLIICSFLSLLFDQHHRINAGLWICATLPMALQLINSKYHYNYIQPSVSLFPALVYTLFFSISSFQKKISRWARFLLASLIFLFSLFYSIKKLSYPIKWFDESGYKEVASDLRTLISEKDKDAFIILNGHPTIYLFTGYLPCYRFFVLQDSHSSRDDQFRKLVHEEFSSLNAKYILTTVPEQSLVFDILEKSYRPIKEWDIVMWDKHTEVYTLFQLIAH